MVLWELLQAYIARHCVQNRVCCPTLALIHDTITYCLSLCIILLVCLVHTLDGGRMAESTAAH